MASRTVLSTFATRLDILLQGIGTADISAADRKVAILQAVQQYNSDFPRREMADILGDAGSYYLLWGKIVAVDRSDRDAVIVLKDSGADQGLSVSFTTTYQQDVHQVNLLLRRIGATVAGTAQVSLYTADVDGKPDLLIADSAEVNIDEEAGARQGIFTWVEFYFDPVIAKLPAGDYCAVLSSANYAYGDGTSELEWGVDQSSVTNDVCTYNGSIWSAYGTDSEGMVEVLGGIYGWRTGEGRLISVECPAADITTDQTPYPLEADQYCVYRLEDGDYLRFTSLAPSSSDTIRMEYVRPYLWKGVTDPIIDTPDYHLDALTNLAAHYACNWLATRYGQNIDSTFEGDVVDQRSQDEDYAKRARSFYKAYTRLTGLDKAHNAPGIAIQDIDLASSGIKSDFMFHGRRTR